MLLGRGFGVKTIAIVDDNILIGDMMEEVLKQAGYGVLRAYSGTEALYLLSQKKPDLILLDLVLPGLSGEEVLQHIQNTPVIVVSTREEVEAKVRLLTDGAVDYMTKPVDTQELLARIAVQFRKRGAQEDTAVLSVGDLTLDVTSLDIMVLGQPVKLTRTECSILKHLMTNPRRIISQSALLDCISLETPDCTERSLKQHMFNLRRKLQSSGSSITIETIRGAGYRLSE